MIQQLVGVNNYLPELDDIVNECNAHSTGQLGQVCILIQLKWPLLRCVVRGNREESYLHIKDIEDPFGIGGTVRS